MNLIVCLDNKNGMAFNHRRQSRDRVLIDDLLQTIDGAPLTLTPYSAKLFEESNAALTLSEQPLQTGGAGYCFVEETDPAPYQDQIDELILYRWNRYYPADVWCTLDMREYQRNSTEEFVGSSHENITKEVWKR